LNFDYLFDFDEICRREDTETYTGVLTSPWPDLLRDVFCLMVRIFRMMLVLLYM
jgi:hypothetical protein